MRQIYMVRTGLNWSGAPLEELPRDNWSSPGSAEAKDWTRIKIRRTYSQGFRLEPKERALLSSFLQK